MGQIDFGDILPKGRQGHALNKRQLRQRDGKFLILQRSYEEEHMPGKWTVPGGKVEHTAGDVWSILED